MLTIVIKGNDFEEIRKNLDKCIYLRQKLEEIGLIKKKPKTKLIYKFIKKALELVSSFKVDNSSNINGIVNELNDFNKNLESTRRAYENAKRSRYLKKLSHTDFLKNIVSKLRVLGNKVNAKKFKISVNNAYEDCILIMEKDIVDNSKNLFFALAESFKEIKEKADECLGSMNEALYKEKYKKENTIDINEAIDYLNMYGKHFKNGDNEFIKKNYGDNFDKLSLTKAAVPVMQGNTRSPLLAKNLFDAILECINSPNQKKINKINLLIEEFKETVIYDFKGKSKELLNVAEEVINISTRIVKKRDTQSNVNETIEMKERKTLEGCFIKIEKLCKSIESDMVDYNKSLERGISRQVSAVDSLLNNLTT